MSAHPAPAIRPASTDLDVLAHRVLMPCFDGTSAPDALLRRIDRGLGAVCLFARNVEDDDQLAALTGDLAAAGPLVVAIDEEAGDVTRLDARTGSPYPGNAALGRADDVARTEQVGRLVGARLQSLGVTLNFAPCADILTDRANPVIGTRSFGTDAVQVAAHTAAFVRGHRSGGTAACVKHFPGHGDTSADTHLMPGVVAATPDMLRRREFRPFIAAIDVGVDAVMVGHLLVPSVDDLPATISRRWLVDILRTELGFGGVIVTDALEMRALADAYGLAGGAVRALAAGADLLCLGGLTRSEPELDQVVGAITDAVTAGELPHERLAEAAHRSLTLAVDRPHPTDRMRPAGRDVFAAVADRAVVTVGTLPVLGDDVLVLCCSTESNIAVGAVPWGPAGALGPVVEHPLTSGSVIPDQQVATASQLVVLTRDRHLHPWMTDALHAVRSLRADAIHLEVGSVAAPLAPAPALHLAGATRATWQAAARLLRPGG